LVTLVSPQGFCTLVFKLSLLVGAIAQTSVQSAGQVCRVSTLSFATFVNNFARGSRAKWLKT